MFDDSELFDKDDTIVLERNKIRLQKYNNEKSISDINKFLKELDGNWTVDIFNDDVYYNSSKNWIVKNKKLIDTLYEELKEKSIYSDVLSNLTYEILCDYLETSSKSDYKYDNNDWNSYEEYKLYGMKKPNINEWTSFHVIELHKLYTTYDNYFKLGNIEDFIKFCFDNSETKQLPKY